MLPFVDKEGIIIIGEESDNNKEYKIILKLGRDENNLLQRTYTINIFKKNEIIDTKNFDNVKEAAISYVSLKRKYFS